MKLFTVFLASMMLSQVGQSVENGDIIEVFQASALVRETTAGWVEGREYIDSFNGETTESLAWLEIPYGRAPENELRWRAPQPPIPWSNLRRATKFGAYADNGLPETDNDAHACVQYAGMLSTADTEKYGTNDKKPELIGSEDCLYLNVWRPKSQDENSVEEPLAVYVWIHGGSNSTGKSGLPMYRGGNFAAKANMVFVSINYRLGPFGFFTHPSLRNIEEGIDKSGNYGALDMIAALTWVQDNISNFGGDPTNVTIAGESAGGVDVYGLMASELASGLFHKAISQSGGLVFGKQKDLDDKTNTLIMDLKLDEEENNGRSRLSVWWEVQHESDEDISNYLRSKSADDILSYLDSNIALSNSDSGSFYVDDIVLKDKPLDLLKNGNYNKVPFMAGNNRDEIKFFPSPLLIDSEKSYVDKLLAFTPETPNYVLDDFIKEEYILAWDLMGIISGLGFQLVGVDIPLIAMEDDLDPVQNMYAYRFDWNEGPTPMDRFIGAGHMLEIPFVFGTFHKNCNVSEGNCVEPAAGNCVDPDNCDVDSSEWIYGNRDLMSFLWSESNRLNRIALSEKMMSYWSNFAKTGNPNGLDINNNSLPYWGPWSDDRFRMILDTDS